MSNLGRLKTTAAGTVTYRQTIGSVCIGWGPVLGTAIALSPNPAWAQITPDNTLGPETSTIDDGVINGDPVQLIEGGAARGSNLFHSFSEFNVGLGEAVYFANPVDIENILSRVTGGDISNIEGLLGVDGSANLFLLNPNGVLFGPDAQLDIAGSLTVSTGDSFVFDEGEFSATDPMVPDNSLLTISVPLGLQLDTPPQGDLINEADLRVGPEQTLTLHGDGVASTVRLGAPGGVAQVLGNQIALLDSETAGALGPSGDTDLLFQASGSIVVEDVLDNDLLFAKGTGQIVLFADADMDGVGDVLMLDRQDTLQTNGRNLAVSGINFVLGAIDTSVQPEAVNTTIIDVDAGGPILPSETDDLFEETSEFTFTVTEGNGTINDLDVQFSAEHTAISDLEVVLTSPDETSLVILEGPADFFFNMEEDSSGNFQDTVIDDEASLSIDDGSTPFEGSFRPEGTGGLAVFNNQSSEGIWRLSITDFFSGFPFDFDDDFPIDDVLSGDDFPVDDFFTDGSSGTLFRAGDIAPWGTAQGTQLIITSLIGSEGSGGAVTLDALGDVSIAEVITVGTGANGQGGATEIIAGGDIAVNTIDTSSLRGQGGNVDLLAGGSIQIGTPSVPPVVVDVTPTVVNVDTGGPIPGSGSEAEFTFTVADDVGSISDLDIRFSAENSEPLEAVLTSPNGTASVLFENIGGTFDENFQDTVLDDEASLSIDYVSGPFEGSFQPGDLGKLAIFDGQSSEGTWTLTVVAPTFGGDPGTLFRAGDTAPWGTAQGTQLLIDSGTLIESGSAAIPGLVDTSGGEDGGRGGQVQVEAENDITLVGDVYTSALSDSGDSSDGGAITIASNLGDIAIDGRIGSGSDSSSGDSGDGGAITIASNSGDIAIYCRIGSYSDSSSGDSGDGGSITISSNSGDIAISGRLDSDSDALSSGDSGDGGAITVASISGDIAINGRLGSESYSESYSDSFSENSSDGGFGIADGDGGAITITSNTGDVAIEGELSASARGDEGGNAGIITISSSLGDVSIEGELDARIAGDGGGNGGAIDIFSGSGNVVIEGQIDTWALGDGAGNGGAIDIVSDSGNVAIEGGLSSGSFAFRDFGYSIFNSGDGGAINISSNSGDIAVEGTLSSISLVYEGSYLGIGNSGNGGVISISTLSGNIQAVGDIVSFSASDGGNASSGGSTSLRAPKGTIIGEDTRILTFAISEEVGGTTGEGGGVTLEAANVISGLEIVTLASDGDSGNTEIQGTGLNLVVEDLLLIASGQAEIPQLSSLAVVTTTLDLDGLGQSGEARITGVGDITFSNVEIRADANSTQPAGNVIIQNPGLLTFIDSEISSNANNEGDAGEVRIDTRRLEIGNGGRIFAATSGSGNGGSVIINATDSVFLGEGVQDFAPIISVEASGDGQPGDISINTPSFVLSETAQITATATATATNTEEGGSVALNADQMNLAGRVRVLAETQGQAPGGTLTLQPYQSNPDLDVFLSPGARISASTSGSGDGGGLQISAPEAITLSGPGFLAVETSGAGTGGNIEVGAERFTLDNGVTLSASTTTGSTGDGGNIAINAEATTLLNSSQIAVNSAGAGQGGDVILNGDSLALTEDSSITAETASTDGGNLDFTLEDTLLLSDGSTLSATAGIAQSDGNGGNITLTMPDGFIVAVPEENSDIAANAFTGDGGNVDITVNSLLGIAFRPQPTPLSDITASSEFGSSGLVNINEINPDVPQNDLELPVDTAPPALAQGCQTPAAEVGSFVITGRGGLPTNPTDVLGTDGLWQDLAPLTEDSTGDSSDDSSSARPETETVASAPDDAPVEAQHWTRHDDGTVTLLAQIVDVPVSFELHNDCRVDPDPDDRTSQADTPIAR